MRGGGGAARGNATSSWRGKHEAIKQGTRGGGAGGHEGRCNDRARVNEVRQRAADNNDKSR